MNKRELAELIEWIKSEKQYYDNPGPYQDSHYYLQCEAKSDVLEEVLDHLDSEWRKRGLTDA